MFLGQTTNLWFTNTIRNAIFKLTLILLLKMAFLIVIKFKALAGILQMDLLTQLLTFPKRIAVFQKIP